MNIGLIEKNNEQIIERLAGLDEKGFILPPGIRPADFLKSAGQTLEWAEKVKENLMEDGSTEIYGEEFTFQQLMPDSILTQCLAEPREKYGVNPGWVPAFFSNRLLPWYVGGACFYSKGEESGRVCFVLKKNFKKSSRWLFYSRREIVSHEICHVARSMMAQTRYEEPLAYRLSESALRRKLGPMFSSNWEAGALLTGSGLLVLGSLLGAFSRAAILQSFFALPLVFVLLYLGLKSFITNVRLEKAINNLKMVWGSRAEAVAFRCTDREISYFSKSPDVFAVMERFASSGNGAIRWAVIKRRFGEPSAGTDAFPRDDNNVRV